MDDSKTFRKRLDELVERVAEADRTILRALQDTAYYNGETDDLKKIIDVRQKTIERIWELKSLFR